MGLTHSLPVHAIDPPVKLTERRVHIAEPVTGSHRAVEATPCNPVTDRGTESA